MPPPPDEDADDGFLAQGPARLQALKAFDQHQTLAVPAQQDRRALALFQHALGDCLDGYGIEGAAAPYAGT